MILNLNIVWAHLSHHIELNEHIHRLREEWSDFVYLHRAKPINLYFCGKMTMSPNEQMKVPQILCSPVFQGSVSILTV